MAKHYIIQASGVFSYVNGRTDGVDAYYKYSQPGAEYRPLRINDQSMHDIAKANGDSVEYNTNHVYSTEIIGTGEPLKLWIWDLPGTYGDNHGSLLVKIFAATSYTSTS